jgi:hypothetical protein
VSASAAPDSVAVVSANPIAARDCVPALNMSNPKGK